MGEPTIVLDEYYYALSALVTIGMQLAFFAVAYGCKFDLVTDFAGSTNFILLAVMTLCLGNEYSTRHIVLTALVCVSRAYLALFLLFRVCTRKKDARFDEVRGSFFKFLAFWIFQMFWAFLCMMPVIYLNSRHTRGRVELGALDYVGWVVIALGIIIQIVADVQKYFFRKNPENKGKFCTVGLWRWSRHPNYYGEMLLWIGAFICVINVIPFASGTGSQIAAGVATCLSPIYTILILVTFTGIPQAEGDNLARYYRSGNGEAWEEYAAQTPPVILFPNCIYRVLPYCVKATLCCELPIFRYRNEDVRNVLTA